MTATEVLTRIEEIKKLSKQDGEAAKSQEIQLYGEVLTSIAAGKLKKSELVNLAASALTIHHLDLPWY